MESRGATFLQYRALRDYAYAEWEWFKSVSHTGPPIKLVLELPNASFSNHCILSKTLNRVTRFQGFKRTFKHEYCAVIQPTYQLAQEERAKYMETYREGSVPGLITCSWRLVSLEIHCLWPCALQIIADEVQCPLHRLQVLEKRWLRIRADLNTVARSQSE